MRVARGSAVRAAARARVTIPARRHQAAPAGLRCVVAVVMHPPSDVAKRPDKRRLNGALIDQEPIQPERLWTVKRWLAVVWFPRMSPAVTMTS